MDLKMPNINNVQIAGKLVRDIETRNIAGGNVVGNGCVVVSERYKKKGDSEYTEKTAFINITMWAQTATYAAKYMQKGTPVLVDGSLTQNQWEDKEGNKRSSIDVTVFKIQSLAWADKDATDGVDEAPQQSNEPITDDGDIAF